MSNLINSSHSDFEIIVSPNMVENIDSINNKIINLNSKMDNIENMLTKISKKIDDDHNFFVGNKEEYINILNKIENVSKKNKNILEENRTMYTKALTKIQTTEEKHMEELRPILNEMTENTQKLENNICDPFLSSRIFYRNWRNKMIPNHSNIDTLNGLLGIPFMITPDTINDLNENNI